MSNESQPGSVTLSPKASFILGLVGGVLVLCSIGFFILLGLTLKGGISLKASESAPVVTAPVVNAPTANAPAPEENKVGTVAPVTSADHVQGAKNAVVTLVEYSDLQCPYCARFHPVMEQLMADPAYSGKLRWVFRHFPLSFHPNAVPAALASECASEQGKFWEMAAKIYENNDTVNGSAGVTVDTFSGWAKELGLSTSKFASCYTAKKYQTVVDNDRTSGTAANVSGTPATIIIAKDGTKTLIPGALGLADVKQMVDAALK